MRVSVVIPVLHDPRLERCLASIREQDFQGEVEIIVVDNDPTGSSRAIAGRFGATYLIEPVRGIHRARNRGLTEAEGEVAAFIDADCIADREWLRRLTDAVAAPGVGGAGGRVRTLRGSGWVSRHAGPLVDEQMGPLYLPFYPGPYIVTGNAAYRMALLRELGGLDGRFISGGDVDLAWRVWRSGAFIVYVPDAIVDHPPQDTVRGHFRQYARYGAGHALLFKKHGRDAGHRFYVNTDPWRQLRRALLRGWPHALRVWLRDRSSVDDLQTVFLETVRCTALIWGSLRGAIAYRTPYL